MKIRVLLCLFISVLVFLQFSLSEDTQQDNAEIPVLAKMVGFLDASGQPRDSFVQGNYCYIASGLGGIVVLDISDPSKPKEVAQQAIDGYAWKIDIYNNIVFVAAHDGGFHIFELSTATTFAARGKINTAGRVMDFSIKDHFAFLADGDNGLVVLDITDLDAPMQIAHYPIDGCAYDIAISDNRSYLAGGLDGLYIFDISNPNKPNLLGKYKSDRLAFDVEVKNTTAFLSDPAVGLIALDVKDPQQVKELSRISQKSLKDRWMDGQIRGNFIYGSCLYGGLEIIDISKPEKMQLVGRSDTTGPVGSDYARAFGVEIKGAYAYMSAYYAPRKYRGLQILKLDERFVPEHNETPQSLNFTPKSSAGGGVAIDREAIDSSIENHNIVTAMALQEAGAKLSNFNLSINQRLGGQAYRLPGIETAFNNPLGLEEIARKMQIDFTATQGKLEQTLAKAYQYHGQWYKPLPLPDSAGALQDSLDKNFTALYELEGKKIPDTAREHIQWELESLPENVKQGLNILLVGLKQSIVLRREAFEKYNSNEWAILLAAKSNISANQLQYTDLLLEKTDFQKLFDAGLVLSKAIDQARPLLEAGSAQMPYVIFDFELDTPVGLIVIGGRQDSVYSKDALLLLDLGGNDVHVHSAGSSAQISAGVSLTIDCSGSDRYITRGNFVQGAGIFGVGILADFAGDDSYNDDKTKIAFGQGAALVGIGILWDLAGNDRYYADSFSQAAAHIGIGLMIDGGGNDYYSALSSAQGYGSNLGFALLLERGGSENYVAGDLYPDAIRGKMHFSNFMQGAGHGSRSVRHPKERPGFGMAGGIGVLLDISGNDSYSAGGFAQGTAYWDAIGMLIDVEGNDKYRAIEYAQGGSVHFGVAGHFDFAGNDSYRNLGGITLGSCKDFSIGVHVDVGGNDIYQASDKSMGTVIGGVLGLFIDTAGNDSYEMYSNFPGLADISAYGGEKQNQFRAAAVFLDLAGEDSYTVTKKADADIQASNAKTWHQGKLSIAIDKE